MNLIRIFKSYNRIIIYIYICVCVCVDVASLVPRDGGGVR